MALFSTSKSQEEITNDQQCRCPNPVVIFLLQISQIAFKKSKIGGLFQSYLQLIH
jgi:hypothetical protein